MIDPNDVKKLQECKRHLIDVQNLLDGLNIVMSEQRNSNLFFSLLFVRDNVDNSIRHIRKYV